MARKKVINNRFPVATPGQASIVMGLLAERKRSVDDEQIKMNDKIDRLKKISEQKIKEIKADIKELENSLLFYAELHKAVLFKDKRSVECLFGVYGFRKSKEVKPMVKKTWAKILDALKKYKIHKAIRIKESVNKDELKTWTETELKKVGARRVEKDIFYYEIDEQDIDSRGSDE